MQNIPVIPFLATEPNLEFRTLAINAAAVVSLQTSAGELAFVSGVSWSYSLPPTNSQTAGVLIPGRAYTIETYVAGDNFTNVGGANVTGTVFIATGETPTAWGSGSTVISPGNLRVYNSDEETFFEIDITQDGPGEIYFQKSLLLTDPDVIYHFTLGPGGAGCVGKINLLGVAGQVAFP